MHKFIDFIRKYKEYFTFLILVMVSLFFISIGDISRLGGFRTVVIGSVGWLQDMFSWIPNTGALKSENKALRELNLQLTSEVTQTRQAFIENKNLREMLQLRQKSEYQMIPSEIVGKTSMEMRNYFTLNKGTYNGVSDGMSVRSDAGLIGHVVGVSDNYSLVELIVNRDTKISAIVQRVQCNGILSWEGGGHFVLKNIPKAFGVKTGDTILTSHYSNKYPPNIPIGWVNKTEDISGDIFSSIHVTPFVNFESLDQVFIITYVSDPEKQELLRTVDEKMKARKIKLKH